MDLKKKRVFCKKESGKLTPDKCILTSHSQTKKRVFPSEDTQKIMMMNKKQHQLYLKDYTVIIRSIYNNHHELSQEAAKQHSLQHRKAAKLRTEDEDGTTPESSLTYGEVTATDFINILSSVEKLQSTYGGSRQTEADYVFVDLGCGRGLPCSCAAISTLGFTKVWGIEIIPELIDIAIKLQQVIEESFSSSKLTSAALPAKSKPSSKTNPYSLLDHARLYLLNNCSEGESISLESLADALCKQLGHKKYKDLMKGCKTFRKYLQAHPTIVKFSNEEHDVELLDRSIPTLLEIENNEAHTGFNSSQPSSFIPPVPHPLSLPAMRYDCGDIFQIPWWESADVVYVASLLFSEEMLIQLSECVERMRPRTWFLSLRPLPHLSPQVVLRYESFFRMSWQMAQVYFYQITDKS